MLLPWFCKDTSRSSIFSMFWLVAMAVGSGGVSGSGWDRRVGTGGCASACACPGCPMAISSSGSAAGPGGSSCPQSGDTGTAQCPGTGQERPQQSHRPQLCTHPGRAATTWCKQHLHLSLLGLTGTHTHRERLCIPQNWPWSLGPEGRQGKVQVCTAKYFSRHFSGLYSF